MPKHKDYVFNMTKEEKLYLDFFNNFVTIEAWAEHHGMTLAEAKKIMEKGRNDNHNRHYRKNNQ